MKGLVGGALLVGGLGPGPPGPSLKSGLEGNWDGRGKMKGRERNGVKEGEGCGRDRFGEGRGERGRARKRKGAGMRKRGVCEK